MDEERFETLNGFNEYKRLIMTELKRASEERAELRKEVVAARLDIQTLKTQASVWGAGAGVVAGALASILLR